MMNVNDLLQKHVEELEDLTKNHAKEKDELVQIQTTARTDLEFKITQVQRELQIASLSLEKRSKELELAQLQGNLTGLIRNHDNALLMMEIGHKAAVQNLKSRQAIEPMVIKMLEEVAKMKRLQPIRKNFPVPYVHIVKKGLLFRKEVRRETRYEKRYEQIEPVVVQNQDSPTIWSLEGQIPNGCFVIYTVSFEGSRFIVSAKSDASRSTRSQHNSRSQKAIVQRSEMSGQSKYTTGITEDELMDALVSVISDVKDVCPCTHTIACPCPHACSYAHPSGVCDMPSLWDNSHITESSPVPPPI